MKRGIILLEVFLIMMTILIIILAILEITNHYLVSRNEYDKIEFIVTSLEDSRYGFVKENIYENRIEINSIYDLNNLETQSSNREYTNIGCNSELVFTRFGYYNSKISKISIGVCYE